MVCYRCGAEFEGNQAFCPECGAAIITDDDKTVVAPYSEKTQQANYDDSTTNAADATVFADNTVPLSSDDETLVASVETPEIAKDKKGEPEEKGKKTNVIAIVAIIAVLIVALVAVLLLFKSKTGSEEASPTASSTRRRRIFPGSPTVPLGN